jgi:hypothetical protein
LTLPAMTALRRFPVCTIPARKLRFAKPPFQGAPCAKAGVRASPRRRDRRLTHKTSRSRFPPQKFLICSYQTAVLPASLFASATPGWASLPEPSANVCRMLHRGDSARARKAINNDQGASIGGRGPWVRLKLGAGDCAGPTVFGPLTVPSAGSAAPAVIRSK